MKYSTKFNLHPNNRYFTNEGDNPNRREAYRQSVELNKDLNSLTNNNNKIKEQTNGFETKNNCNLRHFRSRSDVDQKSDENNIVLQTIKILNYNGNNVNKNLVYNEYNNNNLRSAENNYLKNHEFLKAFNKKPINYKFEPKEIRNDNILRYANFKLLKNKTMDVNNPKNRNAKSLNKNSHNSKDKQKENMVKLINDNKYLYKENKEIKKKMNSKTKELDKYISQLKAKDKSIQKLRENLNIKNNHKYNLTDNEKEQIAQKNIKLMEENEQLKLKIREQIEKDKNIMKDRKKIILPKEPKKKR